MAKVTRATKPAAPIVAEVAEEEVVLVEKPEEPDEVAMVVEPTPVPDKLVRIRAREAHSCHIGGTNYDFEKGKVYPVPANVRDILSRADLLSPL